jgi:uncharacterized OB-fold protein
VAWAASGWVGLMTGVGALLPDVNNPILAPHWEAARRGSVAIRFCLGCETPQWPPRYNCLNCHGFDFEWREVSDRGQLFTYFTARKALHPSLADEVPYVTAAVVLPVGVKLLGRLVGIEPDDVRIGMPLRACYVQRTPDVTLVHWEADTSVDE